MLLLRKKKHRIPLSKKAIAIHKTFPRELARLIGTFAGSDTHFLVGDTYIDMLGFHTFCSGRHRVVLHKKKLGAFRWYRGRVFQLYTVVRITPCSIIGVLQKEYHVYGRYGQHFTPDSLDGVFVIQGRPHTQRFMYPNDTYARYIFSQIEMDEAIPIINYSDVRYNKSFLSSSSP